MKRLFIILAEMNLSQEIGEDFLEIFYDELCCSIDGTQCNLFLRVLKIENNDFCYSELIKKLTNAVIHFSLSRMEVKKFEKDRKYGELYRKAVEKFRTYNQNDGEAGELLLYCFLEAHLKAPKILTKLEIKTSTNDYVKGSDGIHLLKVNDSNYQLVFGESKLDANLTTSITNAFKSIHEFIHREKNNITYEVGLIDSQLCKEAFDETLYNFIKKIIFPSINKSDSIEKDNAFGIFAGFEFEISDSERKMSNTDCRESIRKRIKAEVQKRKGHIQKKIEELNLYGYNFYIYAFPFTKIDDTRKDILERLINLT